MDELSPEQVSALELVRASATCIEQISEAKPLAIKARGSAMAAAEALGVPREDIVKAAGLSWPMSKQRWSEAKQGNR